MGLTAHIEIKISSVVSNPLRGSNKSNFITIFAKQNRC